MPGVQANDVDIAIKQLIDNESVIGYVVVNGDGIPVKYHDSMPYTEVCWCYCELLSNLGRNLRMSYDWLLFES